jgi:hypothetical protein
MRETRHLGKRFADAEGAGTARRRSGSKVVTRRPFRCVQCRKAGTSGVVVVMADGKTTWRRDSNAATKRKRSAHVRCSKGHEWDSVRPAAIEAAERADRAGVPVEVRWDDAAADSSQADQ